MFVCDTKVLLFFEKTIGKQKKIKFVVKICIYQKLYYFYTIKVLKKVPIRFGDTLNNRKGLSYSYNKPFPHIHYTKTTRLFFIQPYHNEYVVVTLWFSP